MSACMARIGMCVYVEKHVNKHTCSSFFSFPFRVHLSCGFKVSPQKEVFKTGEF